MKTTSVSVRWLSLLAVGSALATLEPSMGSRACAAEGPSGPASSISVRILRAPVLDPGENGLGEISGTVTGVVRGEAKLVIYAYGDKWYVQPWANAPDTKIREGGTWEAMTHGGYRYAVLLVKPTFKAPATLPELPEVGGDVLAVEKGKPRP